MYEAGHGASSHGISTLEAMLGRTEYEKAVANFDLFISQQLEGAPLLREDPDLQRYVTYSHLTLDDVEKIADVADSPQMREPLTAAEKSRISCRRTEAARDALWAALRPSPVAVAEQAAEIARNAAMTRAVVDDVLAEVCGTEFAAAHEPRAVVSGARGVISLGNAVLTVRGDRFTVLPIGYTSRAPLVDRVPCPADLADFLLEMAAEPRLSHHAACA